jgi:hypothetical protein
MINNKRWESFFATVKCFKFTIALRLLSTLFDEISDRITTKDFFGVEDFVKVAFQFLTTFFDIFRTFVSNSEELFPWEWRTE